MNEKHKIQQQLAHATADLTYSLHCFGDEIARREGYKAHDGIEAIHYFLMQRHGWTPAQVRSMSDADLRFAMEEEMHGWTLPPEARP